MTKTLIILIPGFPSDENDSTCLPSPQSFIRSLNSEFPLLKIVIVAFHYPYRIDQYSWHNNTVFSFNGKSYSKWLRPLLWINIIRRLNRLIKTEDVIGILSFWCLEEAMIGKYYCSWREINHKIWMHGQEARKNNPFLFWIRPKAKDLVAISESLAETLKANYNITPAHVIHNAIEQHNEYPITSKTIDLLSAGSLTPLKQYNVLLRVAKHLKQGLPNLKVVLVGNGPEKAALEKTAREFNLDSSITFTGELPHEKVLELMRRSKVFLHPSSYEGYSTVCLEALYAGCHVVSFVYPEKKKIEQWHVVMNEEHMQRVCKQLLSQDTKYSSIMVHDMRESARKMMALFMPSQ